jgi:hypothetical protein
MKKETDPAKLLSKSKKIVATGLQLASATKMQSQTATTPLTTLHLAMVPTWSALTAVFFGFILGSWSSIDSSKNNTVNSFNYYVGDTIIVEYEPNESKVVFRKKGTE